MTDKVDVKGENAHEYINGQKKIMENQLVPKWNFHKILINKEGKIQDTLILLLHLFKEKLSKKLN